MRIALVACFVAALAASALYAQPARNAQPAPPSQPSTTPVDEIATLLSLPSTTSTSVRGPNDGELRGGVPFPMVGPGLRFNPLRSGNARYGTVEMVQALVRAAMSVHRELPGSELVVNDLGLRRGGPIAHHASHQAGRDVDVLFYVTDRQGNVLTGVGAPLDPAGEGTDFKNLADPTDDVPLRMDVLRSWRFVEHLLLDPNATVQRIFLAEHLRTILLEHARRVNASPQAIARFEESTCQPQYPHDDHFHFRFFCSAEDIRRGCEDSGPIYPWHRAAMRALRVSPRLARPRPDRPRAPVVTEAQAQAQAGEMHADVRAWLDRREAWRRQPHPGRQYCR